MGVIIIILLFNTRFYFDSLPKSTSFYPLGFGVKKAEKSLKKLICQSRTIKPSFLFETAQ